MPGMAEEGGAEQVVGRQIGKPGEWFAAQARKLQLLRAKVYLTMTGRKIRAGLWLNSRSGWVELAGWTVVIVASIKAISRGSGSLGSYFSTAAKLSALQNFLVALGGAFVGGTAITASLVLFAMQVNVQRLPHGLFHRLSSDTKLLAAFALSFALAVAVCASSLLPGSYIALALPGSLLATLFVLRLYLFSYRRSLSLISPKQQLEHITGAVLHSLTAWSKRADHGSHIIRERLAAEGHELGPRDYDSARIEFFDANPGWYTAVLEGITNAIAVGRRSASVGDYTSAQRALAAVLSLNSMYVTAKKRTFINVHPFFDNPRTTDPVINASLEALRQLYQGAVAMRDETLCGLLSRAFAQLVGVYTRIDYPHADGSKGHASLAAGYLQSAVETIVPTRMADPLMEGLRAMGTAGSVLVTQARPSSAISLADAIGGIGAAGGTVQDLRPVTLTAMEQLAHLTLVLLRSATFEDYAARHFRRTAAQATVAYMRMSEVSAHRSFLAPYYSSTTPRSLHHQLTLVANAIGEANADDANAGTLAHHLAVWIGETRQDEELLQLAVELRSPFLFDALRWSTDLALVAVAVARAPACSDHDREPLRAAARRLVMMLGRLPGDAEAANHLENHGMTELLSEVSIEAYSDEYPDISRLARDVLLRWATGAGVFLEGWATLERTLIELLAATLHLEGVAALDGLLVRIEQALANVLAMDVRQRAAASLRTRADNPIDFADANDDAGRALAGLDRQQAQDALRAIADLLAPPHE